MGHGEEDKTGQMGHGEEDRLVRWGTGRKIDWSDGARGGR